MSVTSPASGAAVGKPPATLAERYARSVAYRAFILGGMAALLFVTFLIDIATGPSNFPLGEVLRGLFSPGSLEPAQQVILWEVRLPYALMAVLVGIALGVGGAEMQTALNNPLASPFTLGISAASAVGASLAIISGFTFIAFGENLAVPLLAFVFAAATTLLIQLLAQRYGATVDTVVLFGIALVFTFDALLWLLQYVADSSALTQIVFWTMGSLGRSTWNKLAIVGAVVALCALWTTRNVWALTALRAGEEQARSFGIPVERLRLLTLMRVSLVTATALAFVGTISFVGLVGPHIARMLLGEDHRYYLPGAALAGALMLSVASILSKVLIPGVILPIGIITAIVGVPMFVALILRRPRTARGG